MLRSHAFPAVLFIVLALGLVGPASASAHPHVFVEPELTLEFDGNGLAGIRHAWIFDEMFSIMILGDYDKNADMVLDKAEIAAIKEGAFDNISEWNYFTYVRVGDAPVPVTQVRDFRARVDGGSLVYEFYIPVTSPAGREVSISVFDPDYYVDFLPPVQESVHLKGAEGYAVRMDIREEPGAIATEWMIAPTMVTVRFKKQ